MTADAFAAAGWSARRLGVVMAPDPADPREALGVCNPACARGADGELYLFPRLVAEGNYSRIGLARVRFDGDAPTGVERLGIALEPEAMWERHRGGGGVEDPRITFVAALGRYVMTYTGWGPLGPRIALATSTDLLGWERLGPAGFAFDPGLRADLNLYPNKDALLFPEPVPGPDGEPAFALLHRPMWDLSWSNPAEGETPPPGLPDPRPGIWVSFAPAKEVLADPVRLTSLRDHRLVALPERPWEEAKLGGGTPPLRTDDGWLVLHHGVAGVLAPGRVEHQPAVRYTAGAMLLDPEDVARVLARSAEPLLEPELPDEREGVVPNVVFPTAIDPRGDHEADVYYGMADARIGAFRLTMGRLPRRSTGGPPTPIDRGTTPAVPRTPPAVTGPVRPSWPTPWPEVDRAVRRLLDGVAEAVGDQLVGLYLHGSLALGDFYPPASDVDFHVATAGALGQPALERLGAMHAGFKAEGGWVARLEGVYLPPAALRRPEPAGERCPTVGSDWDFGLGRPGPTWVLDRWVTRERGVVVRGPDPRKLIDPIGPDELRTAVLASLLGDWAGRAGGGDVAWLRPRNYQAFAVLTMCRDLYVLERGVLVSKPVAAAWARSRLGSPWAAVVERSLAWRADERVDDDSLAATLGFVGHAVELARSRDRA